MTKDRWSFQALAVACLVVALVIGPVLPAQAAPAQVSAQVTGQEELLPVVLNEVMPKPAEGEAAWVELFVGTPQQQVFLPLIASSAPGAGAAGAATAHQAGISLTGWQVSNELGQVYTLPADLPPLPNNTYVLIYFDGNGPAGDDYDLSGGRIVLHTPPGLGDIFADMAGQAALYRPGERSAQSIVDFAAWGSVSNQIAGNAIAAGVWGSGQAVSFENGLGDISQEDILERDESVGRYPGAQGSGAILWANYPTASLTPGSANPVQPVLFITPENGARVDTETLALSWRQAAGADAYRFQLDDAADFATPLIDTVTPHTYFMPESPLAAGLYHWRINPLRAGQASGWSGPFQIEAVDSGLARAAAAEKVLGIARIRQNKDSRLLGLDGAPEGDPTTDAPENAWDAAAPCVTLPCADTTKFAHGSNYCVRASIRMMASWYGGSLSMDRISHYVLEEWSGNTRPGSNDGNPDNDLGFARGMYYPDEEDEGISWALNAAITTPGGKPSFADIKGWIDDDRPIMFRNPGHMMVMDGYRENASGQFIHVLDPDQPPNFERWQDYSTQTIDGYWVGPNGGTARSDEASIGMDSDVDGIMDFDEIRRFQTDPLDADSDGDWVPDKQDMREYVFTAGGAYNFRGSDWDSDGVRKELDPDNDGDGSPDGCEDTNFNGTFEMAGETDNFNAGSNQACVPQFDILYPLKVAPVNAGDPMAPDKILVQVSTAVPAGWSLSLAPADFTVTIGGSPASVLSIYPSADTYFLVVAPAAPGTASFFDLQVSLAGGGSDSEANAVFFVEKPANDQVMVLDRSGSMSSDGKMEAAKNAASAFVEYLNDGDAVGVASFASSASLDKALAPADAAGRADAIATLNGLSPSGLTALGQGAQTGHAELSAHGDPGHDWTLVLLSDGHQNVTPYWNDVSGGITGAVAHTVALGDDADTALLQQIAGEKNGHYFFVDVDPPAAASAATAGSPSGLAATLNLNLAATLPNRLADVYVSIGELVHRYQRLYDYIDAGGEQRQVTLEVPVGSGLPEAIFALNWDSPAGFVRMSLVDPSGADVTPDEERSGDTLYQLRVRNPMPGMWNVKIQVLKPTTEYAFMLSGKSATTLMAAVGGNPQARFVGTPVPIYGVLTDEKPIAGAEVYALIAGPGRVVEAKPEQAAASPLGLAATATVQLFDDGNHGDGQAGDGLYANSVLAQQPGSYAVKLFAAGTNNAGEPFRRYAQTGFDVLRRVLYVWQEDEAKALHFAELLQSNGLVADLAQVDDVPDKNLFGYNLVVVGPDTGYLGQWGTAEAHQHIVASERPVLGLGEGGYAFFGRLQLAIGHPNGAHGRGTSIRAVNGADPIWHSPYELSLPTEGVLLLYAKESGRVDIFLGDQPSGVQVFGLNDTDERYADLIMENGFFTLWGFDDGPREMTDVGRQLFANTAYRTLR